MGITAPSRNPPAPVSKPTPAPKASAPERPVNHPRPAKKEISEDMLSLCSATTAGSDTFYQRI